MPTVDLAALRPRLMQSGTYLGDPALMNRVHWDADGRQDIVVRNLIAGAAPTPNQRPSPAVLSAVLCISDQSYWLTSNAGWKGPTAYTTYLHQAKANCLGIHPNKSVGLFLQDFAMIAHNANLLQDAAVTPNSTARMGFASNRDGPGTQIKFRYVLFEVSMRSQSWNPKY